MDHRVVVDFHRDRGGHRDQDASYGRCLAGAVAGCLAYYVLYYLKNFFYTGMLIGGLQPGAAAATLVALIPTSIFNGGLAILAAPPLALAVQKALNAGAPPWPGAGGAWPTQKPPPGGRAPRWQFPSVERPQWNRSRLSPGGGARLEWDRMPRKPAMQGFRRAERGLLCRCAAQKWRHFCNGGPLTRPRPIL